MEKCPNDSLSMDEDEDWRCEMEMEVIGKVPRPAIALEREQKSLLSPFTWSASHCPPPWTRREVQ